MSRHGVRVGCAIAAAVVTVGFASACSEDTNAKVDNASENAGSAVDRAGDALGGAASSVSSAASSVVDSAPGWWDEGRVSAFVAAFRTGWPQLSTDRDDASIEQIVAQTCDLREQGANETDQVAKVKETAANGDAQPSDEDASRIHQLVQAACP